LIGRTCSALGGTSQWRFRLVLLAGCASARAAPIASPARRVISVASGSFR
jgi:hypothetical protein